MDIEDTDLTREELDFLIERLSRENDELTPPSSDSKSISQTEIQFDLKTRLRRGIDELRANNENVPPDLLRILERL